LLPHPYMPSPTLPSYHSSYSMHRVHFSSYAFLLFSSRIHHPPRTTLFPYTTLFRSKGKSITEAVRLAKSFITTAIEHSFTYTKHVGPTYHAAERKYGEAHPIKVFTENIN